MKTLTLTILFILFSSSVLAMSVQAKDGREKKNMLKALDRNGDQAISLEEFKASPNKRFEKQDLNSDGVLTLNELQQNHANREAERLAKSNERLEKIGERFDTLDANSDGTVSIDEAKQGMFNHLDADGNGLITFNEARKARKQHRRHPRPHRDTSDNSSEGS